MNKSQFAALIGVSAPMVTKYLAGGCVALGEDGKVDVPFSLEALEGHLDEGKRQNALRTWAVMSGGTIPAAAPALAAPRAPSAKLEKDAIERDLRMLELGRQSGELVLASAVDEAATAAVAAMREAFVNSRRDTAAQIAVQFGVSPDRVGALSRVLAAREELALGRFAQAVAEMIVSQPEGGEVRAPLARDAG